jgi:hypothetical protein
LEQGGYLLLESGGFLLQESEGVPENTVAPVITGSHNVSAVASSDNGTWTNTPDNFLYQWQRSINGTTGWTDIPGATGNARYTTVADSEKYLRVQVIAQNAFGDSCPAYTAAWYITPPPGNVGEPEVSGTLEVGQTLSVTNGTWLYNPTSFTYQWYRAGGVSGETAIGGATASLYTLVLQDSMKYIHCRVTGTNITGSGVGRQFPTGDEFVTGIPIPQGMFLVSAAGSGVLTFADGLTASILDSNVHVDSTAADAVQVAAGTGTVSSSGGFRLSGSPGYTDPSGRLVGSILSGQAPLGDPLVEMPAPIQAGYVVRATTQQTYGGANNVTLSPGVYIGGIVSTISAGKGLTLNSGVYYIKNGPFSVTGGGNLVSGAGGVLIFMDPLDGSDLLTITNTGTITLSPMMTGTWNGLALFQRRDSANTVTLGGDASGNITGAVYVPLGILDLAVQNSPASCGSQFVAELINVDGLGGGSLTVDWAASLAAKYNF